MHIGFLAEDMFARSSRVENGRGVEVVWEADIDRVDLVRAHLGQHLSSSPEKRAGLAAELLGAGVEVGLGNVAERDTFDLYPDALKFR